jgi:hypothetical protein
MRKSFKQLILVFTIIAGLALSTNAQEIGVRFGGTNGAGGAAVDGVFEAGQFSRIHANFGIYNGGIGIDALWDFIDKPLGSEAFNWYLGVGPSLYVGNDFWLGASVEIGLEYRFETAPIALGFDWRPTLWLLEETKFGANSFGFNVRYIFGN